MLIHDCVCNIFLVFLQEAEARSIFQQLILAVDYCHRMGVANRDIKLENVLLGGDKKNPVIKLTDFGFSKSDLDSIPTTICGTPGYMGMLHLLSLARLLCKVLLSRYCASTAWLGHWQAAASLSSVTEVLR